MVLGPYSGVLIVATMEEAEILVSCVASLVLFLCSLVMSVCESRHRRSVSRLWFLCGLAWVACGWVVRFRKDFTQKPLEWQTVAVVSLFIMIIIIIKIIIIIIIIIIIMNN